MSAMTTSPAFCSAGGSTSGSFGAPSVTVTDASMQSPIRSGVSADMPDGQVDGDDRDAAGVEVGDDGLVQALERRAQARAEHRVDDEVVRAHLGEMQLPRALVGHFDDGHAEPAEDVEVDAGVALDLGDVADEEDRDVSTPR